MAVVRLLATCVVIASLAWGCSPCAPAPVPPSTASVETIDGFHNPEDIEVVASAGLAIVSNTATDGNGSLSALSLADPGAGPRALWPRDSSDDFDPSSDVGDADCRADVPPECRTILAKAFSPHGIAATRLDGDVV